MHAGLFTSVGRHTFGSISENGRFKPVCRNDHGFYGNEDLGIFSNMAGAVVTVLRYIFVRTLISDPTTVGDPYCERAYPVNADTNYIWWPWHSRKDRLR